MAPVSERAIRVLVVDDEELIRRFVEQTLRGAGYEVIVASDGPEALSIVDAQAVPFDVFVLDVLMPKMRGDELARQVHQRYPEVKVLFLTAYSDRLFAERNPLWANEAFIEKPVTGAGLREAVSMIVFGHPHGPERDGRTIS